MHIRRLKEVSTRSGTDTYRKEEFSHVKRGCFSPDGSSFITVLCDHFVSIYETGSPEEDLGYKENIEDAVTIASNSPILPRSVITGYEDVRDICYFPQYTAEDPDSCCFLVAARGTPIHLYDIRGGKHHFTYKPLNVHEELADAYSLDFHPLGKYFLSGSKGAVHVFDIESPGVNIEVGTQLLEVIDEEIVYLLIFGIQRSSCYQTRRLYTNRKSGQCGIISAISHNPYSFNVYACGDYNASICVYDHNTSRHNSLFGKFSDDSFPLGSVTQLRWIKEHLLLVGTRNDLYMRVFDLRITTEAPLMRFRRAVKTNQRIEFDVKNDLIISGTSDGDIVAYSLESDIPRMQNHLSDLTVSVAKYHPNAPLILTASGTRNFHPHGDASPSVARVDLWHASDNTSEPNAD